MLPNDRNPTKLNTPPDTRFLEYHEARACMDRLFELVSETDWYDRPVPERHRLVFYLGHVEAFDWNLIGHQALERPSFHPTFDRLFAFGIDPEAGRLPHDQPSDWPSVQEVRRYVHDVRNGLTEILHAVAPFVVDVCIEHRLMHVETFTYLLHNLSHPLSNGINGHQSEMNCSSPVDHTMIGIPAGTATLGRDRSAANDGNPDAYAFGWDNEFNEHVVRVPAFAVSKYKVTNGQYLAFVEDGAPPPHFWRRRDGEWHWRTFWGDVPLPLDCPVYVTHHEARAYAQWAGLALPTEAQFHRAAYGTMTGENQIYPWGTAPPTAEHGNFNFQRWDPLPVTATPLGESAFGVAQLVGNGWEWTDTVFAPFPGFEPFSCYPGYSAPFFDGNHYVLKGGSPCTAARFLRRSFRNWFRPSYPYVYAGFRCVEN